MPTMIDLERPPRATARVRDFSLVLGGPFYQLLRRARMSDETLGLAHRRTLLAALLMWAPAVAFAAWQGGLLGGRAMPLLEDVGFHLRFLVTAPLLIIAEPVVHARLRPLVEQFRIRHLVRSDQSARFADALGEAARWRNSMAAELALLGFVYVVGLLFTWRRYLALAGDTWYAAPTGGLSLAGLWMVFVSLPLLQFLLLRWYFRLFVWARFLWRVSRLDLDLNAVHPDRAGGLGFLGGSLNAFVPIALAHGALFTGMMADRIFFAGAALPQFQVEVFGGAVVLTVVFAGPLAVFAPQMARYKRAGLAQYGALGQRYVRTFREKWIGGGRVDEPLIGSADIQSLADLANSYAVAEQMRIAPVGFRAVLNFTIAFLAPMLPLLLTIMPAEKLIQRLVGLVF